jgi:histidine phosphotransferase ChpT
MWMLPDKIALAQAVCTRLCHDLGGAVGALANALDLMDGAAGDAMDVARDASTIMDRRIRFYRAAVGAGCGDCRVDELAQVAEGLTLGRRAMIDLNDLEATIVLPAHVVQAVLLALWTAIEGLPRGGTVRVGGDLEGGISIWPDGPSATWPPILAAGLAGEPIAFTPRNVSVPLLVGVAAGSGIRLEMLHGRTGVAAPLLLTAVTRN